MNRDYEKLISAGNKAQLEKLKLPENQHKRGFDDIDIHYAVKRITEEINELVKETFKIQEKTGYLITIPIDEMDIEAVRKEAADVANFAHMIILKCDQELNK